MTEKSERSESAGEPQPESIEPPAPLRLPQVWVLEDSPQQANMVKDALSALFEVTLFFESPPLVEALASRQPDVLLLDWVVPDISGLDVLKIVRQTQDEATVPVLMVTAQRTHADDLLHALDAGANDFATKPFERSELRARVATLARIRRLHERTRQAEHQLAQALAREEHARRHAEAQSNLLTAVLDHAPVGVVVVAPDGRQLFASQRAQAELRHSGARDAQAGASLDWPALKNDGVPFARDQYPTARALAGEEAHGAEVGYLLDDGSACTLQVSYGPVRDADEQINAGVVVFQDVTSRKAAALQDQRRAEFEKQLIGIVSHDLRTPIGAIALGAALLAKDPTLTERQSRLVEHMVSASGRAARMIVDLLDFTAVRLGGGITVKRSAVDLHELARRVTAEVLLADGQHRRIDCEQSGDASGSWDGDRLAQLLVNLIANALHYSPVSSTVRVETRGESDAVLIAVHNGGPPIQESLMPRLFLPMQRGLEELEPSRRSVGLGLFIVDEIVRAHGGKIDVRSTADEGTTFSVRLPR